MYWIFSPTKFSLFINTTQPLFIQDFQTILMDFLALLELPSLFFFARLEFFDD